MFPAHSTAMDHGDLTAMSQEGTDMNARPLSHSNAVLFAAIGGLFLASTTAQADRLAPWLSPAFYGDELDRCTAELRTALDMSGAASLQHTVTNIEKVAAYYVFDIETSIADSTGAVINRAKTSCKSHRFRVQTTVEVTNQAPVSNARLASAVID